ncbi:hypothetical protein GSI_02976 [Ganoderma sinense ZZ0214-1]|uniref:Uncharacterized protein n=1 Tax=Ganoderma sinense ZZ0214-1 TaxID=1077348 RepID=A0A2G8SN41_9APHY|nr:hypothetical protein GSI_02976 [Ganoderma sinense ZZ0214-1]
MFEKSGHSVREAYIQLVYGLGWYRIIKSLPTNPTLLTHLTIDAQPWSPREEPNRYGENFFGGLAYNLRQLCIHQVPFLPTDKFPNLTHFVVTGLGSFTLHIVLSVLSNMPMLQTANLDIEIEKGSIAQCHGDSDAIVQLPQLHQLVLKDSAPCSITGLLPMIKFASTCLVHIDQQMGDDLVSIAGSLYTRDFAQNLTRLRIIPNHVYNDGDEDNQINLYYLEVFDDTGTSGLRLGIREMHSGLWTAYDRNRVTDTLADFLSSSVGAQLVSNVRKLWVHMWTDLVNDSLLAAIPPIDTLGLVLARPPYVRTEIPESIGQLTEGGDFTHCPNLTSLYVYTCGAEDVDRARIVATARKEAGRPLDQLAIECEQGKSSLEVRSQALELEGLVGKLSVTVGEKKRAWWKPCAIPEGYGPSRWPEWQEYWPPLGP